jgi:hypothetical protein
MGIHHGFASSTVHAGGLAGPIATDARRLAVIAHRLMMPVVDTHG